VRNRFAGHSAGRRPFLVEAADIASEEEGMRRFHREDR
jgi:hypothetical protein